MLFLLIFSLWSLGNTQLNLYNTDRNIQIGQLYFDCLHYYAITGDFNLVRLGNPTDLVIKYCLRPLDNANISIPEFSNNRDQNFIHLKNFVF
jgi:hypothetical protein